MSAEKTTFASEEKIAHNELKFYWNYLKLNPFILFVFKIDWSIRVQNLWFDFTKNDYTECTIFHELYTTNFTLKDNGKNKILNYSHGFFETEFVKYFNCGFSEEIIEMCKTKESEEIQNSKIYKDYLNSYRGKISASNLGLI